MEAANDTKDRELRISRLLNAPVELVWEVWTDPKHISQWWGPDGFTNTIFKMDLTPGGEWHLIMHGPDGTDYRNESVFREIIPFKKIVYEHRTGPRFTAIVQFESQGDKTRLDWHMVFPTREEFVHTVKTFKADVGLRQNIEKLEAYIAKRK